ncbi:MAG: trypsin-like serine protease [Nannocystaceae bacterium]
MKSLHCWLRVVPPTAAAFGLALSLGAPARAAELPEVAPPNPSEIYMGQEVQGCAWPTAVSVTGGNSLCTGTLIHELIVVYAAHCGGGNKKIGFGNDAGLPSKTIQTEYCLTNPDYGGVNDQGHDWAFCKLAQPITEIPVTPPVMGCEGNQYLTPGSDIAIVGFGDNTQQGGAGIKRWAITTLLNVFGNTALVGGNPDPGICSGDSGGPAFVQYDDGTWHAFGIASTVTGGCGGQGVHSLIPAAVGWIEDKSGIDVTPCHTVNGQWDPTWRCQGFSMTSQQGSGEWSSWCDGNQASGSSNTCGDPFDVNPDETAPVVSIVDPLDQAEFTPDDKPPIIINADDGDGWGIVKAWVAINGADQPEIFYPPYEYKQVQFPMGVYTLVAKAEDAAGFTAESAPVTIYVGVEPGETTTTTGDTTSDTGTGPDTDPTTDGTTDDSTDPGTSDGGTTAGPGSSTGDGTGGTDSGSEEGGDEGCGCTSGGESPWAALTLLALVGLPRRRR